ncbi:DNA-binding helix-turn-helix protein [Subdoligranulum variabile DSM 15176]|uniref:DNA-binding helix-turn-helix protein n=2 Tax=Subdoligranulum variabile TaxID=214851 RepID=D1PKS6_9FIRM|nr:DNA-binding helix-turn-helix protein [Subdoligranulum variabile DSM 15176]
MLYWGHRQLASEIKEARMAKNLKLKAARAEKDMTQGALAEAVGVSRQTINAIEKGEYNPTINLCKSICKALDKTLDDLFWEE